MTNFGRQLLAPVFIDDVAQLAADALADPAARDQVFELGGPETMPMRQVIARALRVADIEQADRARARRRSSSSAWRR